MICAIVLAAGASRRMGTRKVLLPFAGSTIIARVVDALLETPVDRVFVVVRPRDDELKAALGARPVCCVENPETGGDMLSSLRCGLRAAPSTTGAFVATPADLPSIEPRLVRALLAAFRAGGHGILAPTHRGRRGHPLVFAARYRAELLSAHDGIGLRGLLAAHPDEVGEWPSAGPAVLEDLDTPADYDRSLRKRAAGRGERAF